MLKIPRLPLMLAAYAWLGAEGPNQLGLHYSHYTDANSVWSASPGLDLRYWFGDSWRVDWSREIDGVSGASRVASVGDSGVHVKSKVPGFIDGITGASQVEFRESDNLALHFDNNGRVAGAGLYLSHENDYRSISPSFDVAWDVANRNATLGAHYAWFYDRYTNLEPSVGERQIHAVGASYTQTLTKLTLAQIGIDWMRSSGYLGRPWNPVLVANGDGTYALYDENLPRRKTALAYSAGAIQGWKLPTAGKQLGSIHADYRYYQDSWKLQSHTIDLKVFQHIDHDLYLRLRGRFYTQTNANFAKSAYMGTETYKTADIKYSAFKSVLTGLKLAGRFPDTWTDASLLVPDTWGLSGDYTIRNTGHDPLRYQFVTAGDRYTQTTFFGELGYEF